MTLTNSVFSTDFIGSITPGPSIDQIYESIDPSQLSVFKYKDTDVDRFASLLVTSISEAFIEGEARTQLLSDNFVSFATGGTPIGIVITGLLLKVTTADHRADFIDSYNDYLRGTAATLAGEQVTFMLKQKTVFDFDIQRVGFAEAAVLPEITQVTIEGVASNYQVLDIIETADTTDYVDWDVDIDIDTDITTGEDSEVIV
jgi:hypothetical protein